MKKPIKLRKCTPAGKSSSDNTHMGKDDSFVITSKFECNKNYIQRVSDGASCGWVYDYEIDSLITIEELEAEKEIAKASVEALQTKIDWLTETGNTEFDEEEYKAHSGAGYLYRHGEYAKVISKYHKDLSGHIGRYIKVLKTAPNGGFIMIGEYGLIVSKQYINFLNHKSYSYSHALTEGDLDVKVELMPEGFSPSEYIQEKEKEKEYVMIEEAKKRYPIGTMFKPAQCKTPNSEFCVVTNTNFKFQNGHVYALTDTGGIWTDAGKYGNTQSNRIVYHGDKKVWADYHNPQIITSIAGFSGLSIQHEKQDTKTFINDVLSVDIKLSKKKKRIRF